MILSHIQQVLAVQLFNTISLPTECYRTAFINQKSSELTRFFERAGLVDIDEPAETVTINAELFKEVMQANGLIDEQEELTSAGQALQAEQVEEQFTMLRILTKRVAS